MGTNDHIPSKSTRTSRRARGEILPVLVWGAAQIGECADLVAKISDAGGYVGFGRNAKGTCLLLYIKLNDWKERVPIETYDALSDTIASLVADI